MSVQAIAWVLENSTLKGTSRCVMVSIANHLGPDGSGWVHVRRVCAEAACSVDSYRRAVREAEAAGELRRLPHEGGGPRMHDRHRPNLFVFPALEAASTGQADYHPPKAQEAKTRPSKAVSGDVDAVFAEWVKATGRDAQRTKLTADRRKRITSRLQEGYDLADLLDAVHGVTVSKWHQGENDRKQRYDDLTTVLRDGAQVERFRDLWRDHKPEPVSTHPALRAARGCDRCERGFIEQPGGTMLVCRHCGGGAPGEVSKL